MQQIERGLTTSEGSSAQRDFGERAKTQKKKPALAGAVDASWMRKAVDVADEGDKASNDDGAGAAAELATALVWEWSVLAEGFPKAVDDLRQNGDMDALLKGFEKVTVAKSMAAAQD